MSNDLTEHSRFRSQALMWAFMIVDQDVNGIACRRYRFFFAFCKLARRRAQSMRPARRASYSRGGGGGFWGKNILASSKFGY